MPQTQYSRGRTIEYKAIQWLASQGYSTFRSAGSKGAFDIIAFDSKIYRLIQIKYTNAKNPTYSDDEVRILSLLCPPNSTKELWIYKKGVGWYRFYLSYGNNYSSVDFPDDTIEVKNWNRDFLST